jgi:hypothetical protein
MSTELDFDKDSFLQLKDNMFKIHDNIITLAACYSLYDKSGLVKTNNHILFALKQTQLILDDF